MSAPEPPVLPADEFNQILVANAHPLDWKNPVPRGRYNLVVLGAGTAGLVSAAGAAALGARVALVEQHLMGGDCLNYGCVPSKAMIRAARAAHAVREAASFGISAGGSGDIDFAEVMRRVRRIRAEISPHDSVQRFTNLGADVFLGSARFVAEDAVEVNGTRLEFSKAIIAAGARAADLPVPGLKETGYLTNETVFSLTELPKRLIVVGAGPIGCELAQAFRRLGSEVTMLTDGTKLIPREEPDSSDRLARQFNAEGITVYFGAQIRRAACTQSSKVVSFDRGKGEQTVSGNQILVAIGRAPNVEGLNLEAAGVKYQKKGVIVDDHLRTSNPRIYAAGDIASHYQFTHAAEALARIALQNALFFGRKKASDLIIPWVTYTDPEIAHVGLYEDDARKKGFKVETITVPLEQNDRALIDGDEGGLLKVHFDSGSQLILGATLVSRHAGESIGELVMAVQQRMKIANLGGIIHPYPTEADVFKRAGDASMKSRLKPWMKQLLSRYFKWRR